MELLRRRFARCRRPQDVELSRKHAAVKFDHIVESPVRSFCVVTRAFVSHECMLSLVNSLRKIDARGFERGFYLCAPVFGYVRVLSAPQTSNNSPRSLRPARANPRPHPCQVSRYECPCHKNRPSLAHGDRARRETKDARRCKNRLRQSFPARPAACEPR